MGIAVMENQKLPQELINGDLIFKKFLVENMT
jgi:hypothetical protein